MGITSFMPREWIGVEGHVFFVSERNPITDTRHDGQQGDLLPFLRSGVVSNEEGVVAVREVVYAQIQPMLSAGRFLFQVPAGIPAEEGGHPVVVHAGIKVDCEFFPCQ